MGLFYGLFKPFTKGDNAIDLALTGVANVHPDAWVCVEPRVLGSSPLLSAAVLLDKENKVCVCFVNADMSWMSNMKLSEIYPEQWVETRRMIPPLMVVHKETLFEINQFSAVRIILKKTDGTATYVAFPWPIDQFDQVAGIDRWIFWSLANEACGDSSHYWGFGHFGTEDDFDSFIERIAPQT